MTDLSAFTNEPGQRLDLVLVGPFLRAQQHHGGLENFL